MIGFFKKRGIQNTIRLINKEVELLSTHSLEDLRKESYQLKRTIEDKLFGFNEKISKMKELIKTEYKYNILKSEELLGKIEKVNKEKRLKEEKILKKLLPKAFAVLKETTKRFTNQEELTVKATDRDYELLERNKAARSLNQETGVLTFFTQWSVRDKFLRWQMIPYDVQLEAAILLHEGNVIEMTNGEGKTLAAIFPAYLNALANRKIHIITANNYLATRDAESLVLR